jgi:hypothetical protein
MILDSITALAVIACDKRKAFAQGSDSDDPSTLATRASPGSSPPKRIGAKAEAIQTFSVASGLLRFARNDDSTKTHQV